mmetsp:Transcript_43890/g.104330  ORF Transcript_43890/g.104330 Transcript_43890/m.104330 type:complete len:209 (-) Transcript_43890:10-636(-)
MRERTSAAPFQSSSPCRISAIFSLTVLNCSSNDERRARSFARQRLPSSLVCAGGRVGRKRRFTYSWITWREIMVGTASPEGGGSSARRERNVMSGAMTPALKSASESFLYSSIFCACVAIFSIASSDAVTSPILPCPPYTLKLLVSPPWTEAKTNRTPRGWAVRIRLSGPASCAASPLPGRWESFRARVRGELARPSCPSLLQILSGL